MKVMAAVQPRSAGRLAGAILLLALVYFAVAWLSLRMAIPPGYASAVWPAAGIALAALLTRGLGLWPGVVLGSFLVNLTVGELGPSPSRLESLALPATIALGAGTQALLGAVLTRGIIRREPELLKLRNIATLLLLGGPVGCLVNATWSVAALSAFGRIEAGEQGFSWMNWWVGDTIGVLIFTPLALIWLGPPREAWRRYRSMVTIVLALFFGVAVAGFVTASREENENLARRFAGTGDAVAEGLERQIVRYVELVHAIQSHFVSSDDVDREQFRAFVARSLERVPGIHALSWNPRIAEAQRAAFEEAARREGDQGFRIMERDAGGRLVPAGSRAEYVAVRFIEPVSGNEDALGYDVYSQQVRRAALDQARDTGQAVATAPITLVQETARQAGVLIFVPVYRTAAVPDSVAQRRSALRGYAVGVFRMGDVFAAAMSGLVARNTEARLYDDSVEGGRKLLVAYRLDERGQGRHVPGADPMQGAGVFGFSRAFDVGQRSWRLELAPDPHYVAAHRSWAGWGTVVVVPAFAALLSLGLLMLTARRIQDRRRAADLARANTDLSAEIAQRVRAEEALQAEKERAQVTLHSIGDAVITTDAEGRVEYLNPVAEKITEWSLREAKGRHVGEVFRIINEETRQPAVDPVRRCLEEGRVIGLANHTVMISRSGREYAVEDSAAPILDGENRLQGVVLVFHDVSESRRMAREAVHLANHDTLTGLVNRRAFDRRLEKALASSLQYGTQHALCYLDLDQFKVVNDTCGHRAGDEMLKSVTKLLSGAVRERDTLARLGGDEFGLLLDNCPLEKAVEIAETLVARLRELRFVWEGRAFSAGVSIGVVPLAGQVGTVESLLSHADVACYAAKELGRNRVHVYKADTSGADPRHREILRVADMRNAIEQDRFLLYSQPIWSLASDPPRAQRHELLLRMLDEKGDLLLPGSFVPAAERFGLMDRIDRWVLRTVFRDYRTLFPGEASPNIAINLSGNLLGDEKLLDLLRELFGTCGVSPEKVCFEVTETAAIRNLGAAARVMGAVREMGGKFALDDFGKGLSSFAYLRSLPVDYLKIDGSLVHRIAQEDSDRAMVEAINQLAHRMRIQTVAEYAVSPECVQVLRDIGVDYAQGNALGAAAPLPGQGQDRPSASSPASTDNAYSVEQRR